MNSLESINLNDLLLFIMKVFFSIEEMIDEPLGFGNAVLMDGCGN